MLQSMGSQRIRHDWAAEWRRRWHPTPVLLPGKSHGWRSLVGCSPWGCEESDTTEQLNFHFSFSCVGEGNGNPLQCSCLENPRDRGFWWAAIYGVTQSRTRLKQLSSSSSSSICYQLSEIWENRDSHQFQKSLILTRSTWLVRVRSLIPTFWAFPGGASNKCRFTTKPCHLPMKVRCRTRWFDHWVEKIPWRGEGQPAPVFLPGESHGQRSLKGYRPWSRTESNTTKVT